MTATLTRQRTSLLDFVGSLTDLLSAPDARGGQADERRIDARFAPSDHLVVRLDVQGGIWSAGIIDVSEQAAQLQVDRTLAERVSAHEPASLFVELPQRGFARIDGRLNLRPPGPEPSPRDLAAITFAYA